jgi:hypothetical protein
MSGSRVDVTLPSNWAKIFQLPLLSTGALSSSRTYTVHVRVWEEALTGDNDIAVGISDGTDVVGCFRADAGNGVLGWIIEGGDGSNLVSASYASWSSGATTVTHSLFECSVALGATTRAMLYGPTNVSPAVAVTTRVIDRTTPLRLVVFGNDAGERYGFYALEVRITEEPP